jgi:hypothetical protein
MRHLRRLMPRVEVESFCSEIVGGRERPSFVVDLSETGLRVERPYVGGPTPRELQVEFELPGVDAIIWARGETCFDQVRPFRGGLLRTTGIRLAAAAARDLRLLRDFVFETRRSHDLIDDIVDETVSSADDSMTTMASFLCFASAYARG